MKIAIDKDWLITYDKSAACERLYHSICGNATWFIPDPVNIIFGQAKCDCLELIPADVLNKINFILYNKIRYY